MAWKLSSSHQKTIKSDRLPDNVTLLLHSLHLNWSQNKLQIHDGFLINWCVNEKREKEKSNGSRGGRREERLVYNLRTVWSHRKKNYFESGFCCCLVFFHFFVGCQSTRDVFSEILKNELILAYRDRFAGYFFYLQTSSKRELHTKHFRTSTVSDDQNKHFHNKCNKFSTLFLISSTVRRRLTRLYGCQCRSNVWSTFRTSTRPSGVTTTSLTTYESCFSRWYARLSWNT